MPGELKECGIFCDLLWSPCGDGEHVTSRATEDPAFTVTGYTRWVALACMLDEIRFYAACLSPGSASWCWTGEQPNRVAAIEAESEDSELAVFESVADAVTFSVNYLGGAALRDIDVVRIKPPFARYKR
jgi:hypothetical protein